MLDQALEEQITDKDQRYNEIVGIWSLLLKQFTHFREAVNAPERVPELRAKYLCLKPTGTIYSNRCISPCSTDAERTSTGRCLLSD